MARVVFPITFLGKVTLFGIMDAKNTADGPGSILRPYFLEQAINIVTDRTAVADAVANNILFDKSVKESEKQHELCVVKLSPIFKQHKTIVQMLKKFYSKTPHTLGNFGITLVANRVVYPSDRDAICTEIAFLINYNNGLPAGTSPITTTYLTENGIDLAANLAAMPVITGYNAAFKAAAKASGKLSQKRDTGIADAVSHLRGTGGFIVGQFPKTPKQAGDWGYVVDNSPKGAKLTTLKFKVGGTKVIYSAVAGSIIQIIGDATLTITKGAAGTGTPIVLKTGDTWQVPMGYTTMKVSNPDLLLTGSLTYMKV